MAAFQTHALESAKVSQRRYSGYIEYTERPAVAERRQLIVSTLFSRCLSADRRAQQRHREPAQL